MILALGLAWCALAQPPTLSQLSGSFQALTKKVNASVVKVVATGYRRLDEDESDEPGLSAKERTSGSGFIIDPSGYIVTNAHVVTGAQRVNVTLLPDGERRGRMLRAEIVGLDFETDIALLKAPATDLPALAFGDSDRVEPGQIVLAFGSPMGLDNSVTMGVVSSTTRQLKSNGAMLYLQTDAPINPGSSGGPLVDAEGRVIGINTMMLSKSGGSEGIGFAVPGSVVVSVIEQLRAHGHVVRGTIGVTAQSITPLLAAGWKLAQTSGVVIADVEEDSTADKAGLQPGDIVLSLNGKPMENGRQFNAALYRPGIGSRVQLELLRDTKKVSVAVELQEKPDPDKLLETAHRSENLIAEFGVFGLTLNAELRDQYPDLLKDDGVLVASIHADGPILDEPFKVADVIYAINRQPVLSVETIRAILKQLHPGDPVAVQIERNGHLRFLSFELP